MKTQVKRSILTVLAGSILLAALALPLASCGDSTPGTPNATAMTPEQKIARGRYLVLVGSCNECHTPDFAEQGTKVPEEKWLTGVPIGWKGPWGTTYASNLRKTCQLYPEDGFVNTMKTAKGHTGRPPMPWTALASMTDADLGAIHAYIKSLGDSGVVMPTALLPGKDPETPYIDETPRNLK